MSGVAYELKQRTVPFTTVKLLLMYIGMLRHKEQQCKWDCLGVHEVKTR
jgi:hypothetical protein